MINDRIRWQSELIVTSGRFLYLIIAYISISIKIVDTSVMAHPAYVIAPFSKTMAPAKVLSATNDSYRVARVDKAVFDEVNVTACAACVTTLNADRLCHKCPSRMHFTGGQVFPPAAKYTVPKASCQPCRVYTLGFQRENMKTVKLQAIYDLRGDLGPGQRGFVVVDVTFAVVVDSHTVIEYVLTRPPDEREAPGCNAGVPSSKQRRPAVGLIQLRLVN